MDTQNRPVFAVLWMSIMENVLNSASIGLIVHANLCENRWRKSDKNDAWYARPWQNNVFSAVNRTCRSDVAKTFTLFPWNPVRLKNFIRISPVSENVNKIITSSAWKLECANGGDRNWTVAQCRTTCHRDDQRWQRRRPQASTWLDVRHSL